MKVLYIDTATGGHHKAYLSQLIYNTKWESVLVLPENNGTFSGVKTHIYKPVNFVNKKFIPFVKWINELSQIAEQEKPDIIHFLNADNFYKYFGVGIGKFGEFGTVQTLHWIRPGKLQHASLKVFSRKTDRVIVHSKYLLQELSQMGIANGVHIEYPQFKRISEIDRKAALDYWGLNNDLPVILCLGNTRPDKGLDILLHALDKVHQPFQLLIAGKAEAFDQEYIQKSATKYAGNVCSVLRYLSDEEVEYAVAASDIVALPYRFSFNGASGPLGEGVCREKCIIGSGHGNLGNTIRENHLGYTFETENVDSLAKTLNSALSETFKPDETYLAYKASLNPDLFVASYEQLYEELRK